MKRLLPIALTFCAFTSGAFATANVDCTSAEGDATALTIEAITGRDRKFLDSLRGEIKVDGAAVSLTKSDVKNFSAAKNILITLSKRTPKGVVEIQIYAKPVDDIDFEGNYVLRAGKLNKNGKVKCSAG